MITLPLTRYRVTYRIRPERIRRTLTLAAAGTLTHQQVVTLMRERYVEDGRHGDAVSVLTVETI